METLWNVSFCGKALYEPSEAKAALCANCETSASQGEEKKSSPRLALRAKCCVRFTWFVKRLGMQATETQVKLDVITGRSQEKNAKPMSVRSSNSFPL